MVQGIALLCSELSVKPFSYPGAPTKNKLKSFFNLLPIKLSSILVFKWAKHGLFLFSFNAKANTCSTNLTINGKSVDGVLGIRTQDLRDGRYIQIHNYYNGGPM